MIFIFSIIAGLQCSVNFLLYSKVTQSHVHIYILFLTLSSIMLYHQWLDIAPSAIQQISLLIHSKCHSWHLFAIFFFFFFWPPSILWISQDQIWATVVAGNWICILALQKFRRSHCATAGTLTSAILLEYFLVFVVVVVSSRNLLSSVQNLYILQVY